jgi:hypothetical protein
LLGDNIGGRVVMLRPIRFHVLVCRILNFCCTPFYIHAHLNHMYTQFQLAQNSTPTSVRHRFTALSPSILAHTIRHVNDGCFSYLYLKTFRTVITFFNYVRMLNVAPTRDKKCIQSFCVKTCKTRLGTPRR